MLISKLWLVDLSWFSWVSDDFLNACLVEVWDSTVLRLFWSCVLTVCAFGIYSPCSDCCLGNILLSKVCGRFTYSTADTGTAHWRGLVGGGSLAPPHTFWPTASFLHVRVSGSRIRFLVVVCVVLLRLHTFSSIYAVFTVIKSEDFFINGMTRYCDKLKTVVSLNNFLLRCPSKCRK